MPEELPPHIAFHHRAHHVPLVIDEERAQGMRGDQRQHDASHDGDIADRIDNALAQQIPRDMADAERQNQRDRRGDASAKEVNRQQPQVRSVKG